MSASKAKGTASVRGRPTIDRGLHGALSKCELWLDDLTRDVFRRLGSGSVSAGARALARKYGELGAKAPGAVKRARKGAK